jgi:hypothetical protein
VIEQVQDDVITLTIEERIGLDYAYKLFAVCGDNALNNDTFCDHLYKRLLQTYDNNPLSNSGLPHCRFYGRSSRICCITHIIALVVGTILRELKSSTYKEAVELVTQVNAIGGTFSTKDCSTLSVYQKIYTFVL